MKRGPDIQHGLCCGLILKYFWMSWYDLVWFLTSLQPFPEILFNLPLQLPYTLYMHTHTEEDFESFSLLLAAQAPRYILKWSVYETLQILVKNHSLASLPPPVFLSSQTSTILFPCSSTVVYSNPPSFHPDAPSSSSFLPVSLPPPLYSSYVTSCPFPFYFPVFRSFLPLHIFILLLLAHCFPVLWTVCLITAGELVFPAYWLHT